MPDKIVILFLGDIIGRPGRKALKKFLPGIIKEYSPDVVIANGENAAGGIGITEDIGRDLFDWVQVLTSGNHIWDKKEALSYIEEESRLLRPANYPPDNPGRGTYVFQDQRGRKTGILNLQGRVFMEPLDCPFRVADQELEKLKNVTSVILVDIHAEATSEKQALGWYLNGRVSAVLGTHTHVPTADERILPGGTAYMTDVGMVGGYNAVIGIRKDQAIKKFLTARPQHFDPGKDGLFFSSALIEVDSDTGKAISIKRIILVEEKDGQP